MDAAVSNIVDALPHQPPFRFLSEITELIPGEYGEAVWRVAGDEFILSGHFPGLPIVPGTLIAEALAQVSGLVAFYSPAADRDAGGERSGKPEPPYKLVQVEVWFKETVAPPSEIVLRSRLIREVGLFRQFDVSAACREKIVARGRLTLASRSGQWAVG